LFNAALAEFELHFFYCNILKKHILNGMPQFSWQPKAKNPPTEFAAGWMLFLVCANGARLGRQKALQHQNECQTLEVHKPLKAAFQYRYTS